MATVTTTPGRILLKKILPDEYHSFVEEAPLDKRRISELMRMISTTNPDQYKDILQRLNAFGENVSRSYGGESSLTPDSFLGNAQLARVRASLGTKLEDIRTSNLPIQEKEKKIISTLEGAKEKIREAVRESIRGTSLGVQLESGTRGNLEQIVSIITGELLPIDSEGAPIPFPVTRGFAEGLTPSQYFVTAQKARLGLIGTKLATPEAGDISNQLVSAAVRLRVTEQKEPESRAGYPVDPADSDYEGSILAQDIPGIAKRGEMLTPQVVRALKRAKKKVVLIHSPITSMVEHGISRQAAGTATGQPFSVGDFAGITACQALTEPLTQMSIGSKHAGTHAPAGLDLIRQLIEVPMNFPNAAAIAEKDGIVKEIRELATGGSVIRVDTRSYVLPPGVDPMVKKGDRIETGQVLSSGIPNPRELTRILGIGEGRRQFARIFSRELTNSGIDHNKRNVEYIARGLVNHVMVERPYKDWLPGDIVEYPSIARAYTPGEGARTQRAKAAVGAYLEEPVAHLTIGTRLTRGMAKELSSLGFDEVLVSKEPPPFSPEMRRAREALAHSDDWLMRFGGANLKRSLMKAVGEGMAPSKPDVPTAFFPQMVLKGAPEPLE